MKAINLLITLILIFSSIHALEEPTFTNTAFLLLSGPSGIGKSSVIKELQKIDSRFIYIKPYTTRALREGETDKIHKSLAEIEELQSQNKLAALNYIFGNYYATPLEPIWDALNNHQFPVLDWPVTKIEDMKSLFKGRVIAIFLSVENPETLLSRLSQDSRDPTGERYLKGKAELEAFIAGEFDSLLDAKIMNDDRNPKETASAVYHTFIDLSFGFST